MVSVDQHAPSERESAAGPARRTRLDASDLDDTDLIEAIAARRVGALEVAHERFSGALSSLAGRVCGIAGEDVVQEVFVRLWNEPHRFDPARGSLRVFLTVQVRGRAIDVLRSEVTRRSREDADASQRGGTDAGPDVQMILRQSSEELRRLIGRLPVAESEPIMLAYFGGHTYREVAALLHEADGTIKGRIRSGLSRLSTWLAEDTVTVGSE